MVDPPSVPQAAIRPVSDSGIRAFLAACRSIVAYLLISAYVVLVGPPAILLAVLFRWPGILYGVGVPGVRLALASTGIGHTLEGAENILRRPAVYCVNHASNVEPPVAFIVLRKLAPRLKIIYKAELRKLPVLGRAFEVAGFVAVERGNRDQSTRAIDRAAESIRGGNSFIIFPEGTRSRTGDLLPFKKGGFIMAIGAQAPVVPMAIRGGRAAMRKGSAFVRPVTVEVKIGTPVETAGLQTADRDELVRIVRERIAAMLTS